MKTELLQAEFQTLPEGADEQVSQTCGLMSKYVLLDSEHPLIQATARKISSQCYDAKSTLEAIWNEARSRLAFQYDQDTAREFGEAGMFAGANDPKAQAQKLARENSSSIVEVLIRPVDVEILTQDGSRISGDCDDFSMYSAALALALQKQGLPIEDVRFVCVSDNQEGILSHVYVKLKIDGLEFALDASHGQFPGWEAQGVTRTIQHSVSSSNGWVAPLFLLSLFFVSHRKLKHA
jgi:hypothetical protein